MILILWVSLSEDWAGTVGIAHVCEEPVVGIAWNE
jgi:hypothetical protein